MTREMIEEKIKKLKNEIKYEKKKMKCCAYGKSDLMYLYELEEELEELEEMLDELED